MTKDSIKDNLVNWYIIDTSLVKPTEKGVFESELQWYAVNKILLGKACIYVTKDDNNKYSAIVNTSDFGAQILEKKYSIESLQTPVDLDEFIMIFGHQK